MRKKVYLLCNAHIDPIWQWDWQEGVSATLSTFRSAVKLADKYDYIFCHNEATVYKYAEEYDPELFESIKALVKKGKWKIIGGWYLQPDCNMPSGESFVRQIRYGFKYFKEKFGVEPSDTAFNVDAFGHSVGLVQIMKKCGQDNVVFCRPYAYERTFEDNLFYWVGVDGSKAKAFRAIDGYSSPLGNSAKRIREKADNQKDGERLVLWGVGNHGGGPSDKDLADIAQMQKTDEKYQFVHSTPDEYFAENEPKSSIYDSLRIAMPGCYTSLIDVKQKHIKLENELYLAEIISTVADIKGLAEYPTAKLDECFENLMEGEFHDVLPGTCVKAGEDNGLALFDRGYLDATKIKTRAYFALMNGQPQAANGEYPILVFNPNPYELTDNVECEFMLADQNWKEEVSHIIVKDGDKIVKSQRIKEDSTINLDWRKKVVFEATLPPMGMKRYSVYLEYKKPEEKEKTENFVYDDGKIFVEIDKNTGLMKNYSLLGKQYVKDGFSLEMLEDNPDPWAMGGFQQKKLGDNGSPFNLSKKPSGIFEGMKSVQVIEDGDICLAIEAFFEKDDSKARVEYRIYKNSPDVDVNVDLYFNEANKIVKLGLPVLGGEGVIGQTAFGTEDLYADGRENVSQRFTGVKTGDKVVALIDKSRYGGCYENGTLKMSLVRGVTYCAHPILDRPIIPSDRYTRKADQGAKYYSFRLTVCNQSQLEKKAIEFNRKPYAVNVFPTGVYREEKNFSFTLSNEEIGLVTLKKAEEKDGYIIRLLNNSPSDSSTDVEFCGAKTKVEFGKYEVKTLLFDGSNLKEEKELIV